VGKSKQVVVAGLGEIGRPIFELASRQHETLGVDISPPAQRVQDVAILHVCYPFAISDFVGETARYIELFRPALTIINSTVAVGTTRQVAKRTGACVVNSPVRGKHALMIDDLLRYTKFVGALDPAAGISAAEHFQSLGMKTRIVASPETSELAKLTETTYFGVMIAWAQEVERYCDQLGQDYDDVVSFYEEIPFFPPVKYSPGIIGGHCVMPNIEILTRSTSSEMLKAIQSSNQEKIRREERNDAGKRSQKPTMLSRERATALDRAAS
jgi:UDP-N-acetyl-D-mannosaminuronate dehydrogenase